MTFTFVIPYGGGAPGREHALTAVRAHLTEHHPEWPIVVAEYDGRCKGEAVAAGVAQVATEGLIVHDADVLVAPEALHSATMAVVCGAAWAMPHKTVYRLSRRGTMRAYAGGLGALGVGEVSALHLERHPHHAPPGGGCTVTSLDGWHATGGIDPRFVGWGGEDISWGRALDTLVGPCHMGDAPMWHLWHEHDPTRLRGGRGSRENEQLASRYLDAWGDADAMRLVVAR